jgi:hypothetical protein
MFLRKRATWNGIKAIAVFTWMGAMNRWEWGGESARGGEWGGGRGRRGGIG